MFLLRKADRAGTSEEGPSGQAEAAQELQEAEVWSDWAWCQESEADLGHDGPKKGGKEA
jgi:hypothetical protein